MRVAIVHDYLNQYGGAERVLESIHALYPDAPVYTSIYDPSAMPAAYRDWDIRTSFIQQLPGWRKHFRNYFLLYPSAFERFDLSGYDLVISSSSAYAKGVITNPGTLHICYCHTPMRFAWRTADYVKREQIGGPLGAVLPLLLTYVRLWDVASSARVDHYIANSREVARRIRHLYKREAEILPPPVVVGPYNERPPGDYYLTGGRLVPYKRIDLAIEAFNALKLPLVVFGDGRDRAALERIAGPTVRFVGRVDESRLRELYSGCRAYLMPGEEDAGIQPVEAMAAGRPVIAYGSGGALDTVIDGVTGRFFYEQTAAGLAAAVCQSRADEYDPIVIRQHAEQFSVERFQSRLRAIIEREIEARRSIKG